ncbi:MAG TPA: DUF1566 domain-containing protein [Terriglobales bacterium]|nr:DUF1566 domain-containing protein [Terriglobales bacterium]
MQSLSFVARGLHAACFAVALLASPAHATFIDRGNGVVYDTTSGLDWEFPPRTPWSNWADANTYVAGLTLDGGGWRLPTINEGLALYAQISALTGCYDCTGNQGLFTDLQLAYWTSETYWGGQPGAFYFGLWRPNVSMGLFQTTVGSATWAVRAGERVTVPEPTSLTLTAGALGVMALMRRRRGRLAG